jgi:hypothetical protein
MSKRMNPEIKSKWLAALRSGEYEQARGGLQRILYRDNETGHIDCGFCCLGVLCDLAWKEDVCYWMDQEAVFNDQFGRAVYNADALPGPVMEWAGLDSVDPEVTFFFGDLGKTTLSNLNDSFRLDFGQIADIIEENL